MNVIILDLKPTHQASKIIRPLNAILDQYQFKNISTAPVTYYRQNSFTPKDMGALIKMIKALPEYNACVKNIFHANGMRKS